MMGKALRPRRLPIKQHPTRIGAVDAVIAVVGEELPRQHRVSAAGTLPKAPIPGRSSPALMSHRDPPKYFTLITLTLNPSPSGRGTSKPGLSPLSMRERGRG